MTLTKDSVLAALRTVADPQSGSDIVTAGIARAVTVEDGAVRFVLEIDPAKAESYEPVRAAAQAAVQALDGVRGVSAVLTAHSAKAPPDLKAQRKPEPQGPQRVPGVNHIIAIASGKGGVGKSTVSANLACALAAQGQRVGLLDADVYGPSQPRMLGVSGRPASPDGKTILPLRNHGVTMMSMGLMTNEDQAVIWRGPMLHSAIRQFLFEVSWQDIDYLVVDLPPGTGDAQLSLSQQAHLMGAVIVTTPQDVSVLDVKKAIRMFQTVNVPILGVVENMAWFQPPGSEERYHLFGKGGGKRIEELFEVPMLGQIPIEVAVREGGDGGNPIVVSQPDSASARAILDIAGKLAQRVSVLNA